MKTNYQANNELLIDRKHKKKNLSGENTEDYGTPPLCASCL